ncbi:hypothetical protein FGO68_gene5401 [Halteria grandinella]|uniref:Uncharacterized protein n=1 Tax=Halteria grandinella TaxID=5974 RepID=A0A8J8SVV3_HALGN|nr:hypothetical protein FGO68_gene5401 [Halteria grandinella]
MHLTLTRAPCYFFSNQFGYYQSPNQIHYGYTVRDYKTTLGGLLKPFQSTTAGYKWNYGKNQSLYYLQQEMKPFSAFGNKVRTIYQETSSGRGIETNVGEAVRKSSLLFEVDLFPGKRPDIFRHSFITDPNNYLYLKLIQKTRKNKVDTDHCSKLLMERALCGDQLYSAKLGLKLGQVYDSVYLENSYLLSASSEIASNFTDSRFLRHKFFTRYTQSYGNAQFKFSLAGGLVQNLTAQPLRVNDNFYLWNYKGIRNIGYHYDEQKDKQGGGLHGENLGFDRYLAFQAKLHQLESPLLSVFNIEPFIHFNAALAPNRNKPVEGDTFLKRYGRASIGFGASLQLLGAAIECYYSPFVYRQKNEIKAEFQINIGID